jgi:hypothetical protein
MSFLKQAKELIQTNKTIVEIPIKKPKIKIKITDFKIEKPINEIANEPIEEILKIDTKPEKKQEIKLEIKREFLDEGREEIGLIILQEIDYQKINSFLDKNKEDRLLLYNNIQIKILVKNQEKQIPVFTIDTLNIESWSKTIKNLIEIDIKIPKKYISKIIPFRTVGKQFYFIVILKQHRTNYNIPTSINWFKDYPNGMVYNWDTRNLLYKHSEYSLENQIETIQDFYSYINEIEKDRQWIERNYSIENSHNIIGLNEVFETIAISV